MQQRLKRIICAALLAVAAASQLTNQLMQPAAAQEKQAAANPSAERFDLIVREDFFAGMAGDTARFEKAMKLTEEVLAKNPKHAEALVWHGSGVFYRAGQAFRKGNVSAGLELWQKGLDEMKAAVALDPDNVAVLIPRAAGLLEASRYVQMPDQARELLELAVGDYEKVLRLQQSYFPSLGTHARGELLSALASGWQRLGKEEQAQAYYQRIVKDLPDTAYAERAKTWLATKTLPNSGRSCLGCHAN